MFVATGYRQVGKRDHQIVTGDTKFGLFEYGHEFRTNKKTLYFKV
ncbi:hypothetical protein [Candidatus Arsenophonus triatominarum]|nr:hypothetical protein [Candidatus Arsenophonus triatominarum]